MDAARFAEFTAYGPDVFASFVADLWERAGYDCSLTDARGPNVVARRGDAGVIRIAATVDATADAETLVDADGRPSVDVVVVPQSTADTRSPPGVEVFDAGRLAELVEELDATGLVDDYLLGRDAARERVRARRRERDAGSAERRAATRSRPGRSPDETSGRGHRRTDHETAGASGSDGDGAPTDSRSAAAGAHTSETDPDESDTIGLARGRAFTLVTVGVVGLCLGTSLGESVGGVLATAVLNGSYLFLLAGMVLDARSLNFAGFAGGRGLVIVAVLGLLLFVGIVSPLWAALAGGLYLAQRRRVERAHTSDDSDTPAWAPLGRHPWYWAIVAGTVGWPVAAVGAASPGGLDAGTVVVGLGSWLAVPLGLSSHGRRTGRPPSRRLRVLGSVPYLGSLAGAIYLIRLEREGEELGGRVGRLRTTLDTVVGSRLGSGGTPTGDRSAGGAETGTERTTAADGPQSTTVASAGGADGTRRRTTGGPGATADTSAAGADASDETEPGGSGAAEEPRWTAANLGPPVRRPPRESRTVRHDGVEFRCTSVASRSGRWRVAWGTATVDGEPRERVFLLQYEAQQATLETVSVSECAVDDGGTVAAVESDGDDVSRLRVLTPSGRVVVDRGFEGEVRSVAADSEGERPLVGVGVRSPPRLVVLDGRSGDVVCEVGVAADPDAVEFREGAGDRWLVAGSETRPAPDAAVRVRDGELVQ
jgi:hypothetical protein